LIVSNRRLLVTQQDTEVSAHMIYMVLFLLFTTPFSSISGGATSPCRLDTNVARKFPAVEWTYSKVLWDNRNANLGLKWAYNTTWNSAYFALLVAQAGFALEPLRAVDGLNARKVLGTTSLQIFSPEKRTFVGDSCRGSRFVVFNAPVFFHFSKL